MPSPGKRWYHVTLGTYNSWLPGDPRGFRSRDHRVHSSGDHKNPPPRGEHAELHRYAKANSSQTVRIPADLREAVCHQLGRALRKHRHRIAIVCVDATHAHLLAELPDDSKQAKHFIGIAKKTASQAITKTQPGQVWSRGCGLKPIRDADHQSNTYLYIERHAKAGAAVWTFRDDPLEDDKGKD